MSNFEIHKVTLPSGMVFSQHLDNSTEHENRQDEQASASAPMVDDESSTAETKTLYISNMSFRTPISDNEQYGTYLVGARPKSVSNAEWKSDVWILEFENPVGKFIGV